MSEPFEETPQESKEPARPQAPGHVLRTRHSCGIIAGTAGITVLALGALLFSTFNHRPAAAGGAPPTPTVPVGWERYSDPSGLFSISIPKGWTLQRQSFTSTEGSSSGSVSYTETTDVLGGPPFGQKTITVQIDFQPIPTDLARKVMCDFGFYKQSNTTLAGLPAWEDAFGHWIVESSSAHFQIGYTYPNYRGDAAGPNPPSPTPMPPGFYEQGQQAFHTLLASFMPTPDTPLQCP